MTGKTQNDKGLSELQKETLGFIRAHPGCTTADISIHLNRRLPQFRGTLRSLMERQLVGQQMPITWAFGEYDSRWYPELVS